MIPTVPARSVAILDAIPLPVFVMGEGVIVEAANPAAELMAGSVSDRMRGQRPGDAIGCVHRHDAPGGCGHGPVCGTCAIRHGVEAALAGGRTTRERGRVEQVAADGTTIATEVMVTATPFDFGAERQVTVVVEDVTELLDLRRLVPICCHCKRVRTDDAYWQSVEQYLQERFDTRCSHGICPDCARRVYPDYFGDAT